MRRIMVVLSLVAIAVVAAAPAIAQVGQEFSEEDVESGGVSPAVGISNKGNNVNLCPTVLQSANSGNVQNEQGVVQYETVVDSIGAGGSSITMGAESAGECTQTISQAASASG